MSGSAALAPGLQSEEDEESWGVNEEWPLRTSKNMHLQQRPAAAFGAAKQLRDSERAAALRHVRQRVAKAREKKLEPGATRDSGYQGRQRAAGSTVPSEHDRYRSSAA